MPKSPGKKRSRKSQAVSTVEDVVEEQDDDRPVEMDKDLVSEVEEVESPMTTSNEPTQSSMRRDLRRQRRTELRSKTTGTGLKIEVGGEHVSSNKRVVFDDVYEPTITEMENVDTVKSETEQGQTAADNEDDDDDKVEEVQSTVAKTLAMKERAKERESEQLSNQIKSRKKKRKATNNQDKDILADSERAKDAKDHGEDDNDLDPSFFAQVDAKIAEQRKQKKEEKKRQAQEKPKGRHTTFVSSEDDALLKKPIPVDQTIELVVLGNVERVAAAEDPSLLACPLSQTAQLYSKSQLLTSTENNASTKKHKKQQEKTAKKKNSAVVPTWKRTRKMNEFAMPGAKSRKARLHGKAAARFVVK